MPLTIGKNSTTKTVILSVVFLFIIIKEILFALAVPPWQNHDEPAHFSYTQYIAEEKRLPVFQGDFTSPKVLSFSAEYAQSEIAAGVTAMMRGRNEELRLTHQPFKSAPSGNQAVPALSPGNSRRPLVRSQAPDAYLGLYYQLPQQDIYQNSAAIYPPLYYFMQVVPYRLFYHEDILTRLYAMRFLSLLLYMATLFVCYLIAKQLSRNFYFSITAVLLVGLQPVFSHQAAGVNSDALLILLTTLTMYVGIRLIRNLNFSSSAWLGITLGLGLLTKPQFIIFPVLAAIPFLYHLFFNTATKRTRIISHGIACLVIMILISGWWYAWSYQQYGSFFMNTKTLIEHNAVHVSLMTAAAYYLFRYLYAALTFAYGFGFATELFLPFPITLIGALITALAVVGLIKIILFRWKIISRETKAIAVLLAGTIGLLDILYTYLFSKDLFLTGSASFPADGRYYLPVVICIVLIGLTGLMALVPRKLHNWFYLALSGGTLVVNAVALFLVILPSFYL